MFDHDGPPRHQRWYNRGRQTPYRVWAANNEPKTPSTSDHVLVRGGDLQRAVAIAVFGHLDHGGRCGRWVRSVRGSCAESATGAYSSGPHRRKRTKTDSVDPRPGRCDLMTLCDCMQVRGPSVRCRALYEDTCSPTGQPQVGLTGIEA